jgi:hypothetical protein
MADDSEVDDEKRVFPVRILADDFRLARHSSTGNKMPGSTERTVLLQLCVFGFGLLINGDLWIGFVPEHEEVLVGG